MWSQMVDMELSDEERFDASLPIAMPDKPAYPPGLRICLTQDELSKLGLDGNCNVGDVIDLRAFACVTSVSKNKTDSGEQQRIELQIEKLAIESEADEETPGDEGG